MERKEYPSQKLLKRWFDYENGDLLDKQGFYLLIHNSGHGYTASNISGESYLSHRLIWIWHNGEIPEGLEIDHIDRVRNNNKIENLRIVTHQENMFNTNSDGYYFDYTLLKWYARVKVDYMTINLGSFDSEEKAKATYEKARAEILDTLRHFRETGKVLETELLKVKVLEDENIPKTTYYDVVAMINGKWAIIRYAQTWVQTVVLSRNYLDRGFQVKIIKLDGVK